MLPKLSNNTATGTSHYGYCEWQYYLSKMPHCSSHPKEPISCYSFELILTCHRRMIQYCFVLVAPSGMQKSSTEQPKAGSKLLWLPMPLNMQYSTQFWGCTAASMKSPIVEGLFLLICLSPGHTVLKLGSSCTKKSPLGNVINPVLSLSMSLLIASWNSSSMTTHFPISYTLQRHFKWQHACAST